MDINTKNAFWEKQEKLFAEIHKHGIQKYVGNNPETKKAFQLKDRCIRCIDERVPGGLNLAGSGTLIKEEDALKYIKESGATGITSHAGCGAAKLALIAKGIADPTPEQIDQFAKEFSRQMSEKSGILYAGHLDVDPPNLHIARAVYYDGTGSFDPSQTNLLPPGFVISRRFLDSDYAKKEVEVAISIAFGDHGFGDKTTTESPLVIIPISDKTNPNLSLEKLRSEIQEITASSADRERIKMDGLTV